MRVYLNQLPHSTLFLTFNDIEREGELSFFLQDFIETSVRAKAQTPKVNVVNKKQDNLN